MEKIIAVLLGSYLLGAIPTALLAGRIIGRIDIRQQGSGNAGATNVYRIFGLKPYLAVLTLDILKGFLAVGVVASFGGDIIPPQRMAIMCGLAAIIGHIWTVFARFKGGKGVATACGVFLGLAPAATVSAMVVYLVVTFSTKYVSLGSMTAAVTAAAILLVHNGAAPELKLLGLAVAALIIYSHRANIQRLLNGTENKTDFLGKLRKK